MGDEELTALVEGPADLALLDEALDALEALLSRSVGGSPEDRNFFMLAVSEVVTNVVQHGPEVPQPHVTVAMSVGRSCFGATVTDDAPPASIAWDSEPTDALDESGRGLDIARAVLTRFSHDVTEEGNVWRLTRSFENPGEDAS